MKFDSFLNEERSKKYFLKIKNFYLNKTEYCQFLSIDLKSLHSKQFEETIQSLHLNLSNEIIENLQTLESTKNP